jgi:hypothetical protein
LAFASTIESPLVIGGLVFVVVVPATDVVSLLTPGRTRDEATDVCAAAITGVAAMSATAAIS